ncbi:hypothetical protein F4819DRAFT_33236 [Hypoxylon fuscum]|nr:hypothetical protein F4819DRAFT_33236 [Hypoxylon fuscum]
MPLTTSPTTVPLSPRVKMEDRKRPAVSSADDMAPPSKRLALNGGSKSKEEPEETWVEVSVFLPSKYYFPYRITASKKTLSPSASGYCVYPLRARARARDLRTLCLKLSSGHSTHHFSTDARLHHHKRCTSPLSRTLQTPALCCVA